jgi:CheY-like chemotaxis protein
MNRYKSTDLPPLVLIDSCEASNDLFTMRMAASRIPVRVFTLPEEALLSVPAIAPDVIVMSIVLKGVSGFQVCRRLRRMHELSSSYIIALTGMRYPGIEDMCKDQGFDEYMLKPVSPDMVQQIVQRASAGRAERQSKLAREDFSITF